MLFLAKVGDTVVAFWPPGVCPRFSLRETEAKDADQPHRIKYRKLTR